MAKNKRRQCRTGKAISKDILIFESQVQYKRLLKAIRTGPQHFYSSTVTFTMGLHNGPKVFPSCF